METTDTRIDVETMDTRIDVVLHKKYLRMAYSQSGRLGDSDLGSPAHHGAHDHAQTGASTGPLTREGAFTLAKGEELLSLHCTRKQKQLVRRSAIVTMCSSVPCILCFFVIFFADGGLMAGRFCGGAEAKMHDNAAKSISLDVLGFFVMVLLVTGAGAFVFNAWNAVRLCGGMLPFLRYQRFLFDTNRFLVVVLLTMVIVGIPQAVAGKLCDSTFPASKHPAVDHIFDSLLFLAPLLLVVVVFGFSAADILTLFLSPRLAKLFVASCGLAIMLVYIAFRAGLCYSSESANADAPTLTRRGGTRDHDDSTGIPLWAYLVCQASSFLHNYGTVIVLTDWLRESWRKFNNPLVLVMPHLSPMVLLTVPDPAARAQVGAVDTLNETVADVDVSISARGQRSDTLLTPLVHRAQTEIGALRDAGPSVTPWVHVTGTLRATITAAPLRSNDHWPSGLDQDPTVLTSASDRAALRVSMMG